MPLKHGTNSVNGVKVGEAASCGGFIGTQEVYAPPSSPLEPPTDVGIASEVFGSLIVYWTPPAFPSGVRFRKYDVVLESRPTSTATWTVALTIPNVSVSRITVAATTPGHQYRAKVQAFGTCGYESPFSAYSSTWAAPEGSLCVGGGCEDLPQTFFWPNGNFNDLEGMTLPVYGFTGAIPGWYCNNVDILPKTMFEPSADPGEVCIHLKLCPKNVPNFFVPYEGYMLPPQSMTPEQAAALPDTYADSWIESTLDFDPDVEHEFRATVARHPNGDPHRLARLDLVAWAAGEAAVLGKEKFLQPCSDACCPTIPSDDPCYGSLLFYDAFAGRFDAVRIPGSVGQLAWYPAAGKIKTVADSGADRVRLRFSAFGGGHEECLHYKRLWASYPDCPNGQQPNYWPAYEPGCKGDGTGRCGNRGWDCLCPHDQNNCFGLLVDCFLPCRPSYGCVGNWHALPPDYLQPGDDSGDYDEYSTVRGVRFAWGNEEKTIAQCDTIEVWVANQRFGCGGCSWPTRFDPVPPCINGEWKYRYYFTEHGQEVGQFLCNGVIPPPDLLVLIDEWDMREPAGANYWWGHTSATLWDNRKKWAFVGPVLMDASGEEDWGEVNPATPSCPANARGFPPPGARSRLNVNYVPAYNEDKAECCFDDCDDFQNWRVTANFCGQTMVYSSDSSQNTSPIGFRQNFTGGYLCTGGDGVAGGGACADFGPSLELYLDANRCCAGSLYMLATGPSATPESYNFCVQNFQADIRNGELVDAQYAGAGGCACDDLQVTIEYFPAP